jgi:hypothetical protein
LDYTFDLFQGLYLAVEWMHHGAGQRGDYVAGVLGADSSERPVFLGQDYAVGIARLVFDMDWSGSVVSITNLRDPSGALVGQLTWLASDWMELIVGGTWNYGDGESEYGLALPAGPMVPPSLQGERVTPEASVSTWARFYF